MGKILKIKFDFNEKSTISFVEILENLKIYLGIIGGYEINTSIDEDSNDLGIEIEENTIFVIDTMNNNDFDIITERCLKYSREYFISYTKKII